VWVVGGAALGSQREFHARSGGLLLWERHRLFGKGTRGARQACSNLLARRALYDQDGVELRRPSALSMAIQGDVGQLPLFSVQGHAVGRRGLHRRASADGWRLDQDPLSQRAHRISDEALPRADDGAPPSVGRGVCPADRPVGSADAGHAGVVVNQVSLHVCCTTASQTQY